MRHHLVNDGSHFRFCLISPADRDVVGVVGVDSGGDHGGHHKDLPGEDQGQVY